MIREENDDEGIFREMMQWIQGELGPDTVLRITSFFPTCKLVHNATPEPLLERFHGIAKEYLNYVYLGNVRSLMGRNTICPNCGHTLITRSGFQTEILGLTGEGCCDSCGASVPVVL